MTTERREMGIKASFDEWWDRVGEGFSGDFSRKELACAAFHAALAQSRNYSADEEVMPEV